MSYEGSSWYPPPRQLPTIAVEGEPETLGRESSLTVRFARLANHVDRHSTVMAKAQLGPSMRRSSCHDGRLIRLQESHEVELAVLSQVASRSFRRWNERQLTLVDSPRLDCRRESWRQVETETSEAAVGTHSTTFRTALNQSTTDVWENQTQKVSLPACESWRYRQPFVDPPPECRQLAQKCSRMPSGCTPCRPCRRWLQSSKSPCRQTTRQPRKWIFPLLTAH